MAKSDIAVAVRGLSKAYRVMHNQEKHVTLAETMLHRLKQPFRRAEVETFWALKDVSFDIPKGQVVGIIGRNGAGKSTLLKIMSRITEATTGQINLYGRIGSLLEVGTGFHPELTGRENIFLNGQIMGMRKTEIKKHFDAIVEFSGVEKFLDTPVKRYSSGMYVRLAFAVAAHLNAEILVVDEVIAVGDVQFQKQCLGKMDDVAKSGRTVLLVSHNLGVIANRCEQAILLANGRVQTIGPASDVTSEYIRQGSADEATRVWDDPKTAPGNEVVRLRAVRILSDETIATDLPIDQPIRIEFDFWNLMPAAQLSCSIHLLDRVGTEVLSTANFPSACLSPDPWFGRSYPAGLYRTRVTIPPNFLNEGKYSASVVVLNNVHIIELWQREVVSFNVVDTGAMRKEWTGGWIGVVRPKLEWQTRALDGQDKNVMATEEVIAV